MKSLMTTPKKRSETGQMIRCLLAFAAILSTVLFFPILLQKKNILISQILFLIAGWLCWTFIEYINHRFWSHSREKKKRGNLYFVHMNHHKHPTEIKITSLHRTILLLITFCLFIASVIEKNFITFFTGLISGFVMYTFIHVILHRKWSAKIFPLLHQFHIHHHCKYPDRCFGVTVIWWDVLFHTAPPKEAHLSERITRFYYGDHPHSSAINE